MRVERGSALGAMVGLGAGSGELVPYIERFLVEHPWTGPYTVDDGYRRPREVGPDDHFHPSSDCLACPRLLYFKRVPEYESRLEKPIGASIQRVFKTGTVIHRMVQSWVEAMSGVKSGKRPYPTLVGSEVRLVEEEVGIGGYADLIVRFPLEKVDCIVEIKTMAPEVYRISRNPQPAHVMQLNCYLHMYGKPARAKLLYFDRGSCAMREFDVEAVDMAMVVGKWLAVRRALKAGSCESLAPTCKPGSKECGKCPAGAFCHRVDAGRETVMVPRA